MKDLARELGVTARQVIDRCRAEGLHVQNSITKLTRTEAEQIRAWFAGADLGSDEPANDAPAGR